MIQWNGVSIAQKNLYHKIGEEGVLNLKSCFVCVTCFGVLLTDNGYRQTRVQEAVWDKASGSGV